MVLARRGMRARTIALILSVALAGTLPSAEAAQGNQGLQDGWAVGDAGQIAGEQLLADQLATIQDAGAGWVRVNFRLGQCLSTWAAQGCNGQTALQTYDQVLSSVLSRNLKVLGLISSESWRGQQSDWTTNNAEHTPGGNGNNAYIQNLVHNAAVVLATHYNGANGPLVSQWEVWNEPNAWSTNPTPGVYSGSTFMYPSNFAQLLVQARSAIKGVNATAVVLVGGVLGLDPGGSHKGARNEYKPKSGQACATTVPSGADYLCATFSAGWQSAGWTKGAGLRDILIFSRATVATRSVICRTAALAMSSSCRTIATRSGETFTDGLQLLWCPR